MIEFEKKKKLIVFVYDTDRTDDDWVRNRLREDSEVSFKGVFHFSVKELHEEVLSEEKSEVPKNLFSFDFKPIRFKFARKKEQYYKVIRGILIKKIDVYFHEDIDLSIDFFHAERNISIFSQISSLVNEDIYIGGNNENAIPAEVFYGLIKEFPNSYEKRLYAEARIVSIINEYFKNPKKAQIKFNNYLNKKTTQKGENLLKTFKDLELLKYNKIYDKLKLMLENEFSYSENHWQNEILQIVQLLYPKYFFVFKEAPIKAVYNKYGDIKNRFIDILLIDSNGHIDVIEIKKPFESSLMSKREYRNNYIPLRELSGTVMQIEKYIYYLNRWGYKGEEFLTNKYRDELPADFDIKIINPKGFIIMGREKNLSNDQKQDFEVVKRKYKNVIDIISYDDLLERLKITIEQIKKI